MPPLLSSLDRATPPPKLGPAGQALWMILRGGVKTGPAWDKAHDICQAREGEALFDRLHGLLHRIEGDESNAAYWFRRAGVEPAASVEQEVQAAMTAVGRIEGIEAE